MAWGHLGPLGTVTGSRRARNSLPPSAGRCSGRSTPNAIHEGSASGAALVRVRVRRRKGGASEVGRSQVGVSEVREAVDPAGLPAAQPLPPFAGGAGAGAGAGAGVSAGAGATALRGILHCRTPPPGCAPDAASNGHSQSAAVATVAAAAALAGATDKKKSRRRSSKSEGGESTLVGYQM